MLANTSFLFGKVAPRIVNKSLSSKFVNATPSQKTPSRQCKSAPVLWAVAQLGTNRRLGF